MMKRKEENNMVWQSCDKLVLVKKANRGEARAGGNVETLFSFLLRFQVEHPLVQGTLHLLSKCNISFSSFFSSFPKHNYL